MRDEYNTNPVYMLPTKTNMSDDATVRAPGSSGFEEVKSKLAAAEDIDAAAGDINQERKTLRTLHNLYKSSKRSRSKKIRMAEEKGLTGYKKIASEYSLETYINHLVDTGAVKDFYGNWSIVLVAPNKAYVYKLWYSDPAFEHYAEFCIKNSDLPFVPKFKGKIKNIPLVLVRDISQKNVKIRVANIETLAPIPSWEVVANILFDKVDYDQWETGSINELKDILNSDSINYLLLGDYGRLTPYGHMWVSALIKHLPEITKNGIYPKDMKLANLMITAKNELKIVDAIFDLSDNSKGIAKLMDVFSKPEWSPEDKNIIIHGKNGEVSPLFLQNKFTDNSLAWFCQQVDSGRNVIYPDIKDIGKLTFNQHFAILVSRKAPESLKLAIAKIIDNDKVKSTPPYLQKIAMVYISNKN